MAISFPGADFVFAEARQSKTSLVYEGGVTTFDIVTPRTDSFQNQITENAVESGALITDHIVRLPPTFTFDFVITETPSEFGVNNLPIIGNAVKQIRDVASGSSAATRVQTIVNQLLRLRDERTALTITGRYYEQTNVYIEDLSLTVSTEGGESVNGSLTLKKIQTVKSQTAAINDRTLASAVQPTAQAKKEAGVQKATAAKGAVDKAATKTVEEAVGPSVIKGVVDGVKKTFLGG